MFMLDLLFAFLVAMILSLLFIPWTSAEREAEGTSAVSALLFFFLILLFATWAGGVWVEPFGPPIMGVAWLPFLFVGLLVALLIAAATEPSRRRYMGNQRRVPPRGGATTNEETAEFAAAAFGVLFWILLVVLIVAVVSSYTMQ